MGLRDFREILIFIAKIELGALLVIGSWLYICLALALPNPFKTLMIYGLLIAVSIPASFYEMRRENRI